MLNIETTVIPDSQVVIAEESKIPQELIEGLSEALTDDFLEIFGDETLLSNLRIGFKKFQSEMITKDDNADQLQSNFESERHPKKNSGTASAA